MAAEEATVKLVERTMASENGAAHPAKERKPKKEPKEPKPQKPQSQAAKKNDGPLLISITSAKEDNLAEWYSQVLTKGDMLAYYDVSGCYIILPAAMHIWEAIQGWFNTKIKGIGVRNCYFPIFISQANLQREKDHIEGFAAEVAWVTKGGTSELEQPVAVRPTSETAMYSYYADRIQSHRDLPLKLNQWNNVVRWEFKHPMPFIRSREFLWQEGHTAHLTEAGASEEVRQVLEFYTGIYQELLAVPVVQGRKTKNEQFPGAHYTETVEGFIPSTGRGIQGGTSHCLGQHFSKMFGITVEDPGNEGSKEGEKKPPINVWQNSWGFTTRSIGIMVLTHGDNKGLVIPPRVAEIQVVVVPVGITAKLGEEMRHSLYKQVEAIGEILKQNGIRVHVDLREGYTPGYKFNDWEMKGVPVRMEFGPKDMENHVVTISRRDAGGASGGKSTIPITSIAEDTAALLETIQADLFRKADDNFRSHRIRIENWDDFVPALDAKNVCLIPHCLEGKCEDQIKEQSSRRKDAAEKEDARAPSMGAKSLCIPFEQWEIQEQTKCLNPLCEGRAEKWVMFGRSY